MIGRIEGTKSNGRSINVGTTAQANWKISAARRNFAHLCARPWWCLPVVITVLYFFQYAATQRYNSRLFLRFVTRVDEETDNETVISNKFRDR